MSPFRLLDRLAHKRPGLLALCLFVLLGAYLMAWRLAWR